MFKLGKILDDWKAAAPEEYAIAMKRAGEPMAKLLERVADHDSVPLFLKKEVRGWAAELHARAKAS